MKVDYAWLFEDSTFPHIVCPVCNGSGRTGRVNGHSSLEVIHILEDRRFGRRRGYDDDAKLHACLWCAGKGEILEGFTLYAADDTYYKFAPVRPDVPVLIVPSPDMATRINNVYQRNRNPQEVYRVFLTYDTILESLIRHDAHIAAEDRSVFQLRQPRLAQRYAIAVSETVFSRPESHIVQTQLSVWEELDDLNFTRPVPEPPVESIADTLLRYHRKKADAYHSYIRKIFAGGIRPTPNRLRGRDEDVSRPADFDRRRD